MKILDLSSFVVLLLMAPGAQAATEPQPVNPGSTIESGQEKKVVASEAVAGNVAVTYENPDDPVYLIGKEIRCPVCQGMPIADSPADMAQSMMKRVRTLHAEGKSKEEIFQYFIGSYGEWVILKPRSLGVTIFVWLLPPVAFLLALWLVQAAIRRTKEGNTLAPASGTGSNEADDVYLKFVRDEVDG